MADEKKDDSGGTKTDREVTPGGKGGNRPAPASTTRAGEKETGGGSGTKPTDRTHPPKGKPGR